MLAPTAEILMRSRYSAYVVNNAQYVFRTWDKDTRPPLKVLREDSSQVFINLEIVSSSDGGQADDFGTVEFIASYTMIDSSNSVNDKIIQQHHENSYFVKQKNRWVYVNEISKVET